MDDAKIADEMSFENIVRKLDAIQSDVSGLKTDVSSLKTDVSGLKTDVSSLKTDVSALKTDMSGLTTGVSGLKTELSGLKADIAGVKHDGVSLRAEMQQGFNDSKLRDEELRGLMKFGLEAREGLRESMQARFEEADKKHDEQIDLLKQAVHHLVAQRPGGARQ